MKTYTNISGGFNLTFKGGLESNPEFTDYIFANANLNTSAGTKSIWPYNGDSTKVGNYFYVGNTSLSVEGYVDGWLVGGKKNFNFSFVLLETKWESEKKLIFDVKNGEIYTESILS